MGSLFSSPKAPTIKPYIPPTLNQEDDDSSSSIADKEVQDEIRKNSLLRRSRGKSGTILTGYNGFLEYEDKQNNTASKTLLGE